MTEWDEVLRTLADNPDDYEREGGTVLFSRHGEERALTLTETPGAGLCVQLTGTQSVPISTFIQKDILGLPRLAKQIISVSERAAKTRPVSFVEGSAIVELFRQTVTWEGASAGLRAFVLQGEPGTTRLIELMAPAGRGKTMLLETVSREFALQYQPEPYPTPLLLKVDLLGRYVGTIDDAIAGSLNNEYYFPGLSQKDVALSVRRRWLILALDGFDELVARVGSRDAFLRITELLDQLDGQGTVILSARESFFELYQVTTAIKTYLQPRRGSYTTSVIRLERWSKPQGVEVFQKLGSNEPEADFEALSRTFQGDEELVFHPFFLTRLAKLWMEGERFSGALGEQTSLARTRYVIETFVDREAREKWIDRDGNPLIPAIAHLHLLAGIAEEMWRSGAFVLDTEELRLAAQLGIEHLGLAKSVTDAAIERVPTHAALTAKERKGVSFLHDRFLYYFVGFRAVHLLKVNDLTSLKHLLAAKEFAPDVSEWIARGWPSNIANTRRAVTSLQSLLQESGDAILKSNVSILVARLCDKATPGVQLADMEFIGDSCRGRHYTDVDFRSCHFWHADLCGTVFTHCNFAECEFADVLLDSATSFAGSLATGCTLSSVQVDDEHYFSPAAICDVLREKGLRIPEPEISEAANTPPVRTVARDRVKAVNAFIRASMKTWDVAVEDVEEQIGRSPTKDVVRAALRNDVLREVSKSTSGPRKTFVRFTVDRDKLMRGAAGPIGDTRIDTFWSALEE